MTGGAPRIPSVMRALVVGGEGALSLEERPVPSADAGQVLVKVAAAGVNRADILQRQGRYPAPSGVPADIPGLELAGRVVSAGPGTSRFAPGDRVFCIVGGGAQAEFAVVPESHLLSVPDSLSLRDAAAIPESFITAHDAIVTQAALSPGECVLVHAVGSGVGLAAVQIIRELGARAFGTSRTAAKLDAARGWGMEEGLLASDGLDGLADFAARCTAEGFNLVLDLVGGPYLGASIGVAAPGGRIMMIGTIAGARSTIPAGAVLSRRLTLRGTVLRSRSAQEKADATHRFASLLPQFEAGVLRPVVDRVYEIADAEAAYAHVAQDRATGKVILSMDGGDSP